MVKVIITDQAAKRLSAELPELLFINFLEQRTLIPDRGRVFSQVAIKFILGDVHDANLEHRVGLGLSYQIIEPTPRAFYLLKLGRVHDLIHLRRKLFVQLRDHLLERIEYFRFDQARIGERLLDQSLHGILDFGCCTLGSRFEALL